MRNAWMWRNLFATTPETVARRVTVLEADVERGPEGEEALKICRATLEIKSACPADCLDCDAAYASYVRANLRLTAVFGPPIRPEYVSLDEARDDVLTLFLMD